MDRTLAMTTTALGTAFAGTPVTPADAAVIRDARRSGRTDVADDKGVAARSEDSKVMKCHHDKVDDVLGGIDTMRAGREKYLPRFRKEKADNYENRLMLTKMTNVYQDIVEGLASKPFEQLVELDGDPSQEYLDFAEDVDGASNQITIFAANTFFNGVNHGIDWIFVDHPPADANVRTMRDYREAGLRPYWTHVLNSNVLDVQSKVIGSKEVLVYFKVLEPGHPDHIREFERADTGEVTWTLYRKVKQDNSTEPQWVVVDAGDISIGVIPMVPFVTGRRKGRTWQVVPPMKSALELQVELYQQESALKFIKTMSGYPMLAANGIPKPKDAQGRPVDEVPVGPSTILWSGTNAETGKAGSWGYVEPSSENMKFLAADNESTARELRELGRQPLTAQASNITVIAAAVAATKARTAVRAWALLLKDTLENALILTALWMNDTTYEPVVSVFINFDDFMDGADIEALNAARERGDISRETYWHELRRRGILSSTFDDDEEVRRLLTELPSDGMDTTGEDPNAT